MLRPEYLAQKLTPYPLPTKDGGVLRTIGDAHAYMMALPKKRGLRAHWQHACRILLQQSSAAPLTRQVHLALFMDGKLDAGAFEHMSSVRRGRRPAPSTNRYPSRAHRHGMGRVGHRVTLLLFIRRSRRTYVILSVELRSRRH